MPYNKLLINLDHLVFTVKYQTLLISKVINYTLIVYRGGLRGALWASARGPALSGAPQIFWASRLFVAPCFLGLHRTVLGGHIIYVSGRAPGPPFNS